MNAEALSRAETEPFRANNAYGMRRRTPVSCRCASRRFGAPTIAAAIAFLLSHDAAFMTGPTVFVRGGASIALTTL